MRSILNIVLVSMVMITACIGKEEPQGDGTGSDVNKYDGVYTVKLPFSENGKKTWLPGDRFIVHGEYAKDQLSIILTQDDISEDGQSCQINIEGVTPYEQKGIKAKYYIAYPGEMVTNESHCKDASTFNGTNAILFAGYNNGKNFIVETLTGGFAFTVSGDFDSYELKGNNDEIVAYTSLTSRIIAATSLYAQAKGTSLGILSGDVVADGKTINHIGFSGNLDLADGFLMTFYKGQTPVKVCYIEEAFSVKRNVFIPLGDITSKLSDYKAPIADTHVSVIPTADAVNLGASGTANSYIVYEPGVYAFKAVKGNSSEGLAPIGSVEVLWESWGTTEEVIPGSVLAQVDFEKDMVYFRIDEDYHPGNAVIAAKNDMGAIMWSWHIWVPATPIEEALYGLSRHMTMDRNLGAVVAASIDGASPESAGLFYQWGRKDPFVGAGDFSTGEPASVAGQKMTLAGGQMTTAKSIKNPTVYADILDKHWNTDLHEEYWGDKKTKYDPCPVGYKVPDRYESVLFISELDDIAGWVYDPSENVFAVGSPIAVYPLGGYITTEGTYAQAGEGSRLWSTYSSSTVSNAYNFRIFEGDGGYGSAASGNGSKPKANGFAVRCVAEKETPFENAPGTPVQGKQTRYSVSVTELSGLCLHTDKSFLWGVGDQGTLAKINFNGTSETVLSVSGDLESVTINPANGDLYFGCESHYISKAKAPDYKGITQVFTIPEAADYGNSGIEGISWYKDNMLLIGTQTSAYMWAYKYEGTDEKGKETWTQVWRKSMRSVAIGMKEIADIHYDPVKDQIWIIDSETQNIYLFNGEATEHLATYHVSFGGNCESVHVDYDNNCIWIADDDTSSRLYKIDFTF